MAAAVGARRRRRHGGGGSDERRRSRGVVCSSRAPLFFVLAVCRIRTFNVGISSTYLRISSVCGPSMLGKRQHKSQPTH